MSNLGREWTDAENRAFLDLETEHLKATQMYRAFRSMHEGYAVILEELDELKAEVWKKPRLRDRELLRKEAIQVAAMAFRFAVDLTDEEAANAQYSEENQGSLFRPEVVSTADDKKGNGC